MENHMHRGAFIEMLSALFRTGDISDVQMAKGFERSGIFFREIELDEMSVQGGYASGRHDFGQPLR